jgi:hypothetical protein
MSELNLRDCINETWMYSRKSDEQIIDETREFLVKHFENTPLIAMLYMDRTIKYYGAFANGAEALEWFKQVPTDVRIVWQPLRNPNIKRKSVDFYIPERHEDLEKEYNHTIKEI